MTFESHDFLRVDKKIFYVREFSSLISDKKNLAKV